jgi:hypothetical protein
MPDQRPDREHLLHLISRVERGVLTPEERPLLRRAVLVLLEAVEAAPRPVLDVSCPLCQATAGRRCVAVQGTLPPRVPHAERRRLAGEQR